MLLIINTPSVLMSLISLFLVSMPIKAANHYVFPSDVSEQSRQSRYGAERVDRYESQPDWRNPVEYRAVEKNTVYPEANRYARYKDQHHQQAPSERYQNGKESLWYDKSSHYKSDDFNSSVYSNAPARQAVQYGTKDNTGRNSHYSQDNYTGQRGNEQPGPVNSSAFINKTQPAEQRAYKRSYQQPRYISDMDADKLLKNERSSRVNAQQTPSNRLYNSNSYRDNDQQQQVRIQYVPVPVYNVPGTLPGTMPGIVTPGNMVPGYSHLSPNYNNSNRNRSGAYNMMGSQYNPFSGFGVLPGGVNPFDSQFNNYSQDGLPFVSPGSMMPFFSNSDGLLSH